MTSYLRFLLAFLVLLSHIGIGVVGGFNLGVVAVVVFYILAGYVVNHLIFDVFQLHKKKCILFYYFERILRIYPLYLFFLCLVLAFALITSYGNPEPDFCNLALNCLIVPLNFYMFINDCIIVFKALNPPNGWWLIPQAWSLGTELLAYFFLPFLLRFRKLKIVIYLVSFIIYNLANFGIINTDIWGYRLLPGVLFIFFMGAFLQNFISGRRDFTEVILLFATYLICIIDIILLYEKNTHYHYAIETLTGVVLGLPIVFISKKLQLRLPLQIIIGQLSYGIFLSHFLGIWFFQYLGIGRDPIKFTLFVFIFSLISSLIGIFFIEERVRKVRFKLSSLCKGA